MIAFKVMSVNAKRLSVIYRTPLGPRKLLIVLDHQ